MRFQSPMGIGSAAKSKLVAPNGHDELFQSPMGIGSAAKINNMLYRSVNRTVSIPDGDRFRREDP